MHISTVDNRHSIPSSNTGIKSFGCGFDAYNNFQIKIKLFTWMKWWIGDAPGLLRAQNIIIHWFGADMHIIG